MSTPGVSVLDQLVSRAGHLYTLPAVAMRVLQLTDDPKIDTRALTALIGVVATVTDLGVAYTKTAQTQTAADAAALAAGMKLPLKTGDTTGQNAAIATAREYLTKNGVADASLATVTFGDLSDGAYHSIDVKQPAASATAIIGGGPR